MAQAPLWATQLVEEVARFKGKSLKRTPSVQWFVRDRECSSGYYYPDYISESHIYDFRNLNSIHIIAGRDVEEQKEVLLHELAHWLRRYKTAGKRERRSGRHDRKFYRVFKSLLVKFDCYNEKSKTREAASYPSSRYYL